MKLAAFDLEISRQVPAGTQDLKRYAPLGISCAAVAFSDRDEITLWQAVPQLARAECQALVAAL